jgi:hypothetical protein
MVLRYTAAAGLMPLSDRRRQVYFRVHNMLASCGVNFPIRLDPFHNEYQELGAEYVCAFIRL